MKLTPLLLLICLMQPLSAQIDCSHDIEPPLLTCVSLSSMVLDNGKVNIWALDFHKTVGDNCTSKEHLIFTFNGAKPVPALINSIHFFKADGRIGYEHEYLAGNAQQWVPEFKSSNLNILSCFHKQNEDIAISVWDENFNTASCECNITIIDNQNTKCNYLNIIISKPNGRYVYNCKVRIDASLPEFPKFVNPVDGILNINYGDLSTEYCISVEKNEDIFNGVELNDVLAVRSHILGIKKLDTPYKLLAADVNKDGEINSKDMVLIRKISIGLVKPSFKPWIFIPANYIFTNPNKPWLDLALWEKVICKNLDQGMIDIKLIGVKLGDIDENSKQ